MVCTYTHKIPWILGIDGFMVTINIITLLDSLTLIFLACLLNQSENNIFKHPCLPFSLIF